MTRNRRHHTEVHPPILRVVVSRRMLVAFLMGFSCGLPLLLTLGLLQAWMKEAGVDLAVIGLIALVHIPYSCKFLWAPFLDRFTPTRLGRRRGWLVLAQVALILTIAGLGLTDPAGRVGLTVLLAVLVAFCSASQDIVVDAYRREDLADAELGLGSSFYIYGYRLGMLLGSGGGLILADHLPYRLVYALMAACILPGLLTSLLTPEPPTVAGTPQTMKAAIVEPLVDYFSRNGALWILAFILFYKIGDTMASAMTTPFYLEIGFSKTEIGSVVKIFGTGATFVGLFLGGILLIRLGIHRSLLVFGILQALSTAGFAVLARIGADVAVLSGVIAFENLSGGMGTAAFVAFMASITNKRFTATQYALLSSLMGVPRALASAPTGLMAKAVGWETFFVFCALVAIPGLLLLGKFAPRRPAAPRSG